MGKIKDIDIMRKQGMSFAQIADKLGSTKDSIQKLYRREKGKSPAQNVSVVDKASAALYNRAVKSALESAKSKKKTKKNTGLHSGINTSDFIGLSIGYFDIETTFSMWSRFLVGCIADQFGNVETYTVFTHPGTSPIDDREALNAYARRLEQYDILVSWNGKLFDIPKINARLAYHDLPLIQPRMHIDAMYLAKGSMFNIGRKSLANAEAFFEAENGKTPLSPRIWDKADHGDDEEFDKIVEHCEADVLVLREIFGRLKKGVTTIHR